MLQPLAHIRILLGVTGGIAAYKSADLVRRLRESGAAVQVAMTPAATAFVAPLTFQAVSGYPVRTELLDASAEAGMGHIELARWANLILIAPATADFLARLAHGMANDLLSTLCLATDQPIAVAPAMNRLMWQNAATQDNCRLLARRGVNIWGPGTGEQACGEIGAGRMLEPVELRNLVVELLGAKGGGAELRTELATSSAWPLAPHDLQGLTVLLTAGPTREPLDPVRFISNRSTGRMGFAVAEAAAMAGARVVLISGPVNLKTPSGVERIDVESALEMHEAVMSRVQEADMFIATAAVADYRAAQSAEQKIKKTQDTLTLELIRNPDILAEVAALRSHRPFTVGFAAETHDVLRYAEDKRRRKNLDLIAANQVGIPGSGFESAQNELHVLWEGGERILPLADKTLLGQQLIALIAERYRLWKS
ncbi:MAG TPA: bifunctional phosphopantothenoylcysteine decarboxylase/phosphopantothenate--cysteine ligase CoaBC [Candidatus Competibacteraceae bacterium]|nr:bifunctional phosphopantothenoylcysteine decarboxylase/phosphopantothenate--cysteine ligase CoaBC [Candidatus Competibacteraceae bacterium]HRZ05871.1 bifunctional phosphopantothenoylcysteine decarboxylase/phosphopantothenate--cysteine ligase CoaBC [Candidatus Competibacteraceae bacterium]HSA46005.1 bifunctional phosphopantothenoylcysteine decarboxylase/phosphopantothenate--cysteine ligase CoaBC [Candidatus Competibacteraceae bacterium]